MVESQVPPIPHELLSKFILTLDLLSSAFLEQPISMCAFRDYDTLYFLCGADVIVNDGDDNYIVRVYHNLRDQ